jgi:hypothetical protein
MAEVTDERQLDANEVSTIDELAAELAGASQAKQQEQQQDDVPEKYRNKSLADIVRMHQESEKLLGRQSSEVGELRKVVDEFITKQTELVSKKQEPVEEVDFFADPGKAVARAIENHPAVAELKTHKEATRKSSAQAEIMRRHPDVNNVISDPEFMEWVSKSTVRQRLLVQADREYDVDAADELFNNYKERKQLVSQTVASEKNARRDTVARASTGSSQVSAVPASKKKYRRADIIDLMQHDPDRYAALAPEIRRAYAEGRVI